MTRAEIIGMIKQAWTTALMDVKDIREDIAESYANWVKALIQAAAPDLMGQGAAQGEGAEGGAGGGGGGEAPPAPEGGTQ